MRYTLAVYGLFTTYDSRHPLVGPTLHFALGSLGSSGPGQTWYPRNWTSQRVNMFLTKQSGQKIVSGNQT